MLALSSRLARHDTDFIKMLLLQARLASGSAASCSSCSPSSSSMLPQRLAARRSSKLSSFFLPSSTAFASPIALPRLLSSSGSYSKSPGVRTRLAAGLAARGKTAEGDSSSSLTTTDAGSQPAPPSQQPAAVPRRTVEQIVKRISRGKEKGIPSLDFLYWRSFSSVFLTLTKTLSLPTSRRRPPICSLGRRRRPKRQQSKHKGRPPPQPRLDRLAGTRISRGREKSREKAHQ